jgi:hypothetical protein
VSGWIRKESDGREMRAIERYTGRREEQLNARVLESTLTNLVLEDNRKKIGKPQPCKRKKNNSKVLGAREDRYS